MLKLVRKIQNNIIAKFVIFVIAIAVSLVGVNNILQSQNDFDIVTFPNHENITTRELNKEKYLVINQFRNQGINFSEEDLRNMNLDMKILDRLIRARILDAWSDYNSIRLSDKMVARFIRQTPEFRNKDDKFDISSFKNYLKNSYMTEEEFFTKVKTNFYEKIFNQLLTRSINSPKLLTEIISKYISEIKEAQLIRVKLDQKGNLPVMKIKEKDLHEFYSSNSDKFKEPEKRRVDYVIIDKSNIKLDSAISQSQIKQYYEENLSEFNKQSFSKVKNDILKLLTQEKKSKLLEEEIKNIEDMVAAGDNLGEIAKKYNAKVKNFESDYNKFYDNKLFSNIADYIFSASEQEVLYPHETEDGKILVLGVASIAPEKVPELAKIKNKVKQSYLKQVYIEKNLEKLSKIEKKINAKNFAQTAKNNGFKIEKVKLSRSNIDKSNLPVDVKNVILDKNKNQVSNLIINGNDAYIVKIFNRYINKEKLRQLKNNPESIESNIIDGYSNEIMNYFYKLINPNIKTYLLNTLNNNT